MAPPQLPAQKKAQIVRLLQTNQPLREIAQAAGVSLGAVQDIKNKMEATDLADGKVSIDTTLKLQKAKKNQVEIRLLEIKEKALNKKLVEWTPALEYTSQAVRQVFIKLIDEVPTIVNKLGYSQSTGRKFESAIRRRGQQILNEAFNEIADEFDARAIEAQDLIK